MGVGPLVASAYRMVIEDARRFRSGREVAAYVGLTPVVHNSGNQERLGSISKHGDKLLRTLLIEAALVLLNRCRKPSQLQAWGRQVRSRVGQKKAAVAVARKLCAVLWAMWRRESELNSMAQLPVAGSRCRVRDGAVSFATPNVHRAKARPSSSADR
jgi:transposase